MNLHPGHMLWTPCRYDPLWESPLQGWGWHMRSTKGCPSEFVGFCWCIFGCTCMWWLTFKTSHSSWRTAHSSLRFQPKIFLLGKYLNTLLIVDCKIHHITWWVPASSHIAQHQTDFKPQGFQYFLPCWKDDCCWMDDFEGQASQLHKGEFSAINLVSRSDQPSSVPSWLVWLLPEGLSFCPLSMCWHHQPIHCHQHPGSHHHHLWLCLTWHSSSSNPSASLWMSAPSTSVPFPPCLGSNKRINAFAVRFVMCRKQQPHAICPLKSRLISFSFVTIVSLFNTLSHVMPSICLWHQQIVSEHYCWNGTFSEMPFSSRTFANTFTNSSPVWDYPHIRYAIYWIHSSELTFGTSIISKGKLIGIPSCTKWTTNATNTQWFDDVQASIVKLSCPLWSW